jgi:hypothetical protein
MLAQMGQMMQLRGAQQQYEQQNNLRDAFSQGTDINDPATFNRIARQDPRLALELRGKTFDQQQKQTEIGLKRADYLGAAFSGLVKNPTLDNAYSIFDTAVQMGIIPSQAAAAMRAKIDATGGDPKQIAALAQQGIDSAISAKDKMSDATSRANNAATVGASYYGSNVSRDNSLRLDKREREKLQIVTGDNGFYTINPFDPNSARPVGMAPPPPQPQPPVTNALANPATASTIVNAPTNSLLPLVQSQPGAPTVANAPVSILKPKQPIRQPVAIMGPDGKSILVQPEQAVGKQPATAFNEKTAETKAKIDRELETAIRNLEAVIKPGGLLEKSTGSGAGRIFDASAAFFGQSTEGAIAGAQLAPIADMVLKMVPRFEGPQSNKDVDSYLAAAGKLADTGLPNDVRKGAAEIILKLMKERKGQFEIKGQEGGGGGGSATTTPPIYATNGKDRIMSTDGGNTWTPVGAK